MSVIYKSLVPVLMVLLCGAPGCGGSSSAGPTPWLDVEYPPDGYHYSLEYSIVLSGTAYLHHEPERDAPGEPVGGVTVSWHNQATGQEAAARSFVVSEESTEGQVEYWHHWEAEVPLVPGQNRVQLRAADIGGGQVIAEVEVRTSEFIPTIRSVEPERGHWIGASEIRIQGERLMESTVAWIGGVPAEVRGFDQFGRLRIAVPRRPAPSPGPYPLRIENPDGASADWSSPGFRYVGAPVVQHDRPIEAAQAASDGDLAVVVWHSESFGASRIYFARSLNGGASWSPPYLLTRETFGGAARRACVAVRGQSVLVLWEQEDPGGIRLYHRASNDGGLSWPEGTGAEVPFGGEQDRTRPTAVMTSSRTAVVVYSTPAGSEIIRWREGFGFGYPARLGVGPEFALGIDAQDRLMLVWSGASVSAGHAGRELWGRISIDEGQSWAPAHQLTDTPDAEERSPVVNGDGERIFVAWRSDAEGGGSSVRARHLLLEDLLGAPRQDDDYPAWMIRDTVDADATVAVLASGEVVCADGGEVWMRSRAWLERGPIGASPGPIDPGENVSSTEGWSSQVIRSAGPESSLLLWLDGSSSPEPPGLYGY